MNYLSKFLSAFLIAALLVIPTHHAFAADVLVNPYAFVTAGSTAGADGTEFDGSTEYISHASNTGWSNSKLVTGSFWIKRGRTGVTERIINLQLNAGLAFGVQFNTSNQMIFQGRSVITGGVNDAIVATMTTTITDTNWHHVLFSFDMASTSNRHIYLDDSAASVTWSTYDNETIVFATDGANAINQYAYAARLNQADVKFQGTLSEIWFNPTTYIDFSVEANRRKFITSGGIPEEVGTDGSTPTGTAPIDYLPDGQTQAGTGAAYAVTGTPTAVDGPNP